MYLINVETLSLELFKDSAVPPYAILSHTWGNDNDEVTFEDMKDTLPKQQKTTFSLRWALPKKPALSKKIRPCASIASADGYSYIWIDSCCIDKSSSAELSEAINSMFRYYRDAKACYAYLEDVDQLEDLEKARWWTRGWTLQELLAPKNFEFFSSDWTRLGSKQDMVYRISLFTGITSESLEDVSSIHQISVAKRMSWAAKRKTTRVEDRAYCLLGLFNVHMPLLYGEGSFAFVRLQEEIMKRNTDQSLFAWDSYSSESASSPVLAEDPSNFEFSGDVIPTGAPVQPYFMTNKGLQIGLAVIGDGSDGYIGILNCCREGKFDRLIGLPLGLAPAQENPTLYYRRSRRVVEVNPKNAQPKDFRTIYITEGRSPQDRKPHDSFWIRTIPADGSGYVLSPAYTSSVYYTSSGYTSGAWAWRDYESPVSLRHLTNRFLKLYLGELATVRFVRMDGSLLVTFGMLQARTDTSRFLHVELHEGSAPPANGRLSNGEAATPEFSTPHLPVSLSSADVKRWGPYGSRQKQAVQGQGAFFVTLKRGVVMGQDMMVLDVVFRDTRPAIGESVEALNAQGVFEVG